MHLLVCIYVFVHWREFFTKTASLYFDLNDDFMRGAEFLDHSFLVFILYLRAHYIVVDPILLYISIISLILTTWVPKTPCNALISFLIWNIFIQRLRCLFYDDIIIAAKYLQYGKYFPKHLCFPKQPCSILRCVRFMKLWGSASAAVPSANKNLTRIDLLSFFYKKLFAPEKILSRKYLERSYVI